MFNRIRISLTAWYVGVLLVIVVLIGGFSYLAFSRSLANEVDRSLQDSAEGLASQLDDDSLEALLGGEDDEGEEDHDEDDEHGVRFFSPSGGDTFYLVLGPDGGVLVDPANVSISGVPDVGSAQTAAAEGSDWATISAGGDEYRLYSVAVEEEDRSIAVVQVGRSLAEHDRQLDRLVLVLGLTGAAGLLLAAVGGLVVAGRALRPVREAFGRQTRFVADASHELRTPLTVIRGNAEMLGISNESDLSPADERSLTDIQDQAVYMEMMLADLSLLARLDEGGLKLTRESLDVRELIDSIQRAGQTLARSKRLRIETRVAEGMIVDGDPVRLRELLMAVVENAVRFSPEGGLILIEAKVDKEVQITVADEGPGIDPEHLQHIFERFYRADEARSRDAGGSGLGLAIAQAIAQAHGGRLTVANAPSGGAVFVLCLPLG